MFTVSALNFSPVFRDRLIVDFVLRNAFWANQKHSGLADIMCRPPPDESAYVTVLAAQAILSKYLFYFVKITYIQATGKPNQSTIGVQSDRA